MDAFITYREKDIDGLQYYILQKEFPHFICKISFKPDKIFVNAVPIAGYKMWLVFNYCLRGKYLPSFKEIDKLILTVMEEMALWFLVNRILQDEKRYKKFKIQ